MSFMPPHTCNLIGPILRKTHKNTVKHGRTHGFYQTNPCLQLWKWLIHSNFHNFSVSRRPENEPKLQVLGQTKPASARFPLPGQGGFKKARI